MSGRTVVGADGPGTVAGGNLPDGLVDTTPYAFVTDHGAYAR